jgi:eukaryotic-like serine/threonine-protein kinase
MIPEPRQWSEIESLFFEALEIPAADRALWVAAATGGREELAREVLTLLEAHEASEWATPRRRIGAYRLERRIGRGGMGEVWLAARADGQFEQRVAIKLVRAGLGVELLVSRFQQERRLLARLNHPNIARLLDGGVSADGRPWLAMEYVEGEPIFDFCEHRGLDLRARIEMIRQLCGAVEYAHRNLIVHRDIKPGNVLVTVDGSPKLLDFGIAKLIESEAGATPTALPMLTPRYASPEQLRGDPVTTLSDVYSLGVLVFELLTGSLPYEARGNTPAEIIMAVATQDALVASRTSNRVPRGDLDAVLAKALEKDTAARYGSVEQFAADLENYVGARPVMARPLTVRYQLGKYMRRHWAGVAAAAAVAIGLTAAAALSIRAAHLATLQQARSERVTQFLEDMLGSVDPNWQGTASKAGSDVRVLDLLPAARARIAAVFADDPAAQARVHSVIGRAYTNLQQFPDAEAELKAALALLPALDGDPAGKAKLLFAAGDLDYLLSHRNEEETELRQALQIFERTPALAADVSEHAIYVARLAAALADVGKKEESAKYADRAARLLDSIPSPSPVGTGIIHANLALVYMKIGSLERARSEARISTAQLSASAKPLHELAEMYMWLEIIERYLGNLSDARAAAERSVEAASRSAGADNALTVAPRIELAYVQALSGDTPRFRS